MTTLFSRRVWVFDWSDKLTGKMLLRSPNSTHSLHLAGFESSHTTKGVGIRLVRQADRQDAPSRTKFHVHLASCRLRIKPHHIKKSSHQSDYSFFTQGVGIRLVRQADRQDAPSHTKFHAHLASCRLRIKPHHIKKSSHQSDYSFFTQGVGFEPTWVAPNGFQVLWIISRIIPNRPQITPIFRKNRPF